MEKEDGRKKKCCKYSLGNVVIIHGAEVSKNFVDTSNGFL